MGRKTLVAAWNGGGCSDGAECAGKCAGDGIEAGIVGGGAVDAVKDGCQMDAQGAGIEK